MVDKVYRMTDSDVFKQLNKTSSDKPIIGICFDWRLNLTTKKYGYVHCIIQDYRNAIEQAGGDVFILDFDDNIEHYKDTLDGYIIPGGRDIHPKFYGKELQGAMVSDIADVHFNFNKDVYNNLPKSCPILGICWGFQFLNVINGGTMIQDLHDKTEHFKKRNMKVVENSWLYHTVGEYVHGNCYHHQGLDILGTNVVPTAIDDFSKIVHALEVKEPGRSIYGILWHPEITFTNESREAYTAGSQKIFRGFIEQCEAYKRSKKRIN